MSTVQRSPSAAEALLADGTTAIIRPLVPADRAAAFDLHAVRMSEASRRMRFFGVSRLAPRMAADRLCFNVPKLFFDHLQCIFFESEIYLCASLLVQRWEDYYPFSFWPL